MIMQAAFFKLTEVIPVEDAVRWLKEGIEKTYKRKGPSDHRDELEGCGSGDRCRQTGGGACGMAGR